MKILITTSLLFISIFLYSQKVVLIEQFTNASCVGCATLTPQIAQFVDENPSEVIMIAYHTPLPGVDSMYSESSEDVDVRMAYYNIMGVPSSVVDGNHFIGSSSTLVPDITNIVSDRVSVPTDFQLGFSDVELVDNQIDGYVNINKIESSNIDNISLFIVLVEKLVLKSSYEGIPGTNSENKYNYVVRKMLSSPYGENLEFTSNEASISFSWNINNFKDLNELRVVAFIQNTESKEIFQSTYFDGGLVSIKDNQHNLNFSFYPNPVHDELYVNIVAPISGNNIKILNINGQELLTTSILQRKTVYKINTGNFQQGIYFITANGRKYSTFIKY